MITLADLIPLGFHLCASVHHETFRFCDTRVTLAIDDDRSCPDPLVRFYAVPLTVAECVGWHLKGGRKTSPVFDYSYS